MKNSKTFIRLAGGFIIMIMLFNFCDTKQNQHNDSIAKSDNQARTDALKEANDQLYSALNSLFVGDAEPLAVIWSHGDDVTQLSPFGGIVTGWDEIYKEFKEQAALKFGGKIACKDLKIVTGTDLGYTICIEKGENLSVDGQPITVSHRATNIFRLENGKWRLIHHHTDLAPQLEDEFYGEN